MKREAGYWRSVGEKTVCLACPHACALRRGEIGKCGSRANREGTGVIEGFGGFSAVHVDPVEKKPLFHYLPASRVMSVGTVGCNFSCLFCQNWDISQSVKKVSKFIRDTIDFPANIWSGLHYFRPKEVIKLALENKCKAIAYTYNEPTIFAEYVVECAKLARKAGLKNILVSNGFTSGLVLRDFIKYIDAVNIDIKSFSNTFYRKICDGWLQPVLNSINTYYKHGIWVEVTTLVIPNLNDKINNFRKIAEFIVNLSVDIPWHISRFFPAYMIMDKKPTKMSSLLQAYNVGKEVGLNYVYIGNVSATKYANTYCPKCGTLLVDRSKYVGNVVGIHNGECIKCGHKISGAWR